MKFLTHLGTLGLAAGLLLACDAAAVSAQTRGAGLAITPVSMVDENTEVLARAGQGARQVGGILPITDFVRSGDVTRVAYRDLDGAMRVAEIEIRGRGEIASR